MQQSANYFCTWHLMYWLPNHCDIPGLQSRDVLCDALLFGENGIAVKSYPHARRDLYFLLDDGWDAGSSRGGTLSEDVWFRPYIGSCQLSEEKFPGYGDTPPERLKTLAEKVKALGWKGLGVWISPTISYGKDVIGNGRSFREFWRTRMEWSKYAGIAYWKVDWGDYDISDRHRKILSGLKKEIYPELLMEHAVMRDPWNRQGGESPYYTAAHRHRLAYSDVLRTYDVTFALSIPTTLSRVAALLEHPPEMRPGCLGLINAEDEVYLCAALGLAFGVMRFDIGENAVNSGPNWAFGGERHFPATRPARRQLDEVTRAVRWQTVYAPAFSAGLGTALISRERLSDAWAFTPDETWAGQLCKGDAAVQSAPGIVARSAAMPERTVRGDDPAPYLVACRNPNGSLSIAALGRVTPERGFFTPRADVRWDVGALSGVVGLFGHFKSLTLAFDQSLAGRKLYAKDLMEDEFRDVTGEVRVSGNQIILDGEWIDLVGTKMNRPGDFSEPGLALHIGEETDFVYVPTAAAQPKRPRGNAYQLMKLYLLARGKGFAMLFRRIFK
ncbi:MAG: hypothetical protein FWF05_04335 [Oscillospiraceae bacterium]|nr:hypothetical protein [Oscillospiraceae bacterium]